MTGFAGLSFLFREPTPTTIGRQAGFTGVSFMITPKILTVKVMRWDMLTRQFVAVRDVQFKVLLSAGTQTEIMTTNAAGWATLDFPDAYIEVSPVAGTIPGGYRYTTVTKIQTLARNYLTVTLLPDALERYYTEWEVL